jgi:hypothetical protein
MIGAAYGRPSLGGSASRHRPAFITTWLWLLYREMWLGAPIFLFAGARAAAARRRCASRRRPPSPARSASRPSRATAT